MLDDDAPPINRSPWQLSLAAMFLLVLVAASVLTIGRVLGTFWCLVIAITLFALRLPSQRVNPVIQGVSMFFVLLGVLAGLAWALEVHPVNAVIPCAIIPGLGYIVGFAKAMDSEQ